MGKIKIYNAKIKGTLLYSTIFFSCSILLIPLLHFVIYKKMNYILLFIALVVILFHIIYIIINYKIKGKHIEINRIFFTKNIPFSKIKKVEHKPNIMANSVRTFGVGGMFVRLGNFKNKKLGYYKAYATNDTNAVLIELKNDKDVVISPEQPENFVEEVKNRLLIN